MNWKTLLVDDEPLARARLKRLLLAYPEVEVIGEAANGKEALVMIEELRPALIFLDIEMPIMGGFELLSNLIHELKVVFTTAYDQYAVKAFEQNSIDYLLKPIEKDRLEKTISRLRSSTTVPEIAALESLFRQMQPGNKTKTIAVKLGDKVLMIRLNDIRYIEAEDKYVFLHTADGKKHLTEYTVTSLRQKLPQQFVQISRGAIINSDHIKEIRKGFNGSRIFVLNDPNETRVASSRSYADAIRQRFLL